MFLVPHSQVILNDPPICRERYLRASTPNIINYAKNRTCASIHFTVKFGHDFLDLIYRRSKLFVVLV